MAEYEYIIKPPGKLSLNLKELWHYRELFYFFTWRDIKVKYKQTILGFLWAVLQPLAMMTIFTMFFSKGLQLSTDDIPAPIFYFSGLLFWNLFSSGLSDASNSMVNNAEIIKKIYFPRLIIPISGILVASFDFLMAFIIYIILLIYFIITNSLSIDYSIVLYFPFALLMTLVTSFGAGSFLAALNVKYRDFRYVIPFMIQFLLFVTPVIYPVSMFSDSPLLKYLLAINPMTGVMMLARNAFTNDTLEWSVLGISFFVSILLFLLGIFYFRKTEAYFADIA